jgi:hypothetical protein
MMDEPNWGLNAGFGPPPEDGPDETDGAAPPPGPWMPVPGPLHFMVGPLQTPQDRPAMPVPYRTFDETYDYATLTGVYEEGRTE